MYKERFKSNQPIAYMMLNNTLKSQQLSHAYLFTGQRGSHMREAALLLAQTLVCPNRDVWACESCIVCQRIAKREYFDMIWIDGKDRTIKKEEILALQQQFMQTGLEQYDKKFYIIEHAERATPEALNSILKFLEEPAGESTTAILITENVENLLPTIISRCQMVSFSVGSFDDCIKELEQQEVDPFMAYIGTQIISDSHEVIQMLAKEEFNIAFKTLEQLVVHSNDSFRKGLFAIQKSLFQKNTDNKDTLFIFCELAIAFFKDAGAQRNHPFALTWWNDAIHSQRYYHISSKAMRVFAEGKDKIRRNVNLALLLDQMLIELAKFETIAKKEVKNESRIES